MKHPLFATAAAIAAPLLLSSVRPADDVAFSPSTDASLTKTFSISMESSLDDMEVTVNGETPPPQDLESTTEVSISITVTDRYESVEGGRPRKLARKYDAVTSETQVMVEHAMMGSQDIESDAETELEGTTVVFTWNEDEEAYDTAFSEEDEGEDEALLAELVEDMDMRAFLPTKGVSEGDSWDVDPNAVKFILAPGGNLQLVSTADVETDMGTGSELSKILDDIEGTITATYKGSKDVDGRRVGVIALAIAVESTKDITEMVVKAAEAASNEMGMEQDIQSADVSVEFQLEGTLLWDLKGGHAHSLEISGDTSSVIDQAATLSMMGEELEVEQALYLEGTIDIKVEFTPQ